jgi:two-component system response regulator FixJ
MLASTPADSTVFVVDDDPAARASVAALVRSRGVKSASFASAEEFLATFDAAWQGCIVLDVRMDGMSGLELQELLVSRGAMLPVIVITGFADVPSAVHAMEHGAVTLLEKPCADQVLWANIQAALERERSTRGLRLWEAEVRGRLATLNLAESDVLDELLTGLTNNAIAARLRIAIRTVEARRAAVLKKMGVNSIPEIVRLVHFVKERKNWRKPA